ncbi:Kunitz/Bovine pancreatic trypsin inhibitor domain protein [Cooperia oncophora]
MRKRKCVFNSGPPTLPLHCVKITVPILVNFSYCGMKGTQNNFLSRQDCERTCYVLDNPCALGPPQMGLDNRPVTCSIGMNTCGAGYWCHFGANQQTTVCCPGRGMFFTTFRLRGYVEVCMFRVPGMLFAWAGNVRWVG